MKLNTLRAFPSHWPARMSNGQRRTIQFSRSSPKHADVVWLRRVALVVLVVLFFFFAAQLQLHLRPRKWARDRVTRRRALHVPCAPDWKRARQLRVASFRASWRAQIPLWRRIACANL